MNKAEISISNSIIRKAAFVYIALPLLCFCAGWLKWYFAIPSCAAILFCVYYGAFARRNKEQQGEEVVKMPKWMPWVIALFSIVYSFFCGIGRLWAQSDDYPWRNAIFRDLILRDWPVKYKYDGALCYYIGQWLPAALGGKLAKVMGFGDDVAFTVGNICLLIYVSLGLSVLFFMLISYLKPKKNYQMILIILMFVLFSGMDIIMSKETLKARMFHLEWWSGTYQYSSITTCMCWVFNQALIPWICTLLVVSEKKVSNFVYIGSACLLCGPFPFVGLFVYCISIGFIRLINAIIKKEGWDFVKSVFSPSNLLSTVFIIPFVGFYFLANAVVSGSGGITSSPVANFTNASGTIREIVVRYCLFVLIEFGIYAIIVFVRYRKEPLFYITIIQLLVYPFLKMGSNYDFTMRASIPAVFMMYLFCAGFIIHEADFSKRKKDGKASFKSIYKKIACLLLAVCLIIGAGTPAVEMLRGLRQVKHRGIQDYNTDYIYTFGGDGPYDSDEKEADGSAFLNFVALNLEEQTFFRVFSK